MWRRRLGLARLLAPRGPPRSFAGRASRKAPGVEAPEPPPSPPEVPKAEPKVTKTAEVPAGLMVLPLLRLRKVCCIQVYDLIYRIYNDIYIYMYL